MRRSRFTFLESNQSSGGVSSVHLFLVVPDGAASLLLQPGVVAAAASVGADVVPHLRR